MGSPFRSAVLLWAVATGCDHGGAVPPPAPPADRWLVTALVDAPILVPTGPEGCLAPEPAGEVIAMGEEREVIAFDGRWYLLDDTGRIVRASDVAELGRPDPLPEPERAGVVQLDVPAYRYGDDGCPAADEEAPRIPIGSDVSVLARNVQDASYHGYVVTDRGLDLVPVRAVDSDGWTYPWQATVQLIKMTDDGLFVIGGAVVIGPHALLTARHMGLDETWCYSRHPDSGTAWYAGEFTCGNIAAPATVHPDGIDIAIAELIRPEAPPYATLRRTPAADDEPIYTSRTSYLRTHAMTDARVIAVGHWNFDCSPWPDGSSFITDPVVGPGDSGGPAFAGDELIGIVHGGRCSTPGAPDRHVFIHVPGVITWIDATLAAL